MAVQPQLYALAIIFTILPIPFVALRFRARRKTRLPLLWDDWLIVLALLATIATGVLMICAVALGGLGRETILGPNGRPDNTLESFKVFKATTWANTVTQIVALGPTKLAVLLFYRRIFRGKIFNRVSMVMIILVCMWTIGFFFSHIFICVPVMPRMSAQIIPQMGGKCVKGPTNMYLAQAFADFSLDFLILILPLPIIVKLQMDLARKIQVFCMFLLGAITVATSVARTAVQYAVIQEYNSGNPNQTQVQVPVVYWPLIESAIGIVAACLPVLRPIVDTWSLDRMRGLIRKTSRSMRSSVRSETANTRSSVGMTANVYDAEPLRPINIIYTDRTDSQSEVSGDGIYVQKEVHLERFQSGISGRL